MKRSCFVCKEAKLLQEFNKDSSRPLGISYKCRLCGNKKGQEYYENNKDDIISRQIAYNHKNSEKSKSNYKKYYYANSERHKNNQLKRQYNITLEEYKLLANAQNNLCAICKKPELGKIKNTIKRLAVDHCHITGKVRGLLCLRCNVSLGNFKDNIALLLKAVEYLRK